MQLLGSVIDLGIERTSDICMIESTRSFSYLNYSCLYFSITFAHTLANASALTSKAPLLRKTSGSVDLPGIFLERIWDSPVFESKAYSLKIKAQYI